MNCAEIEILICEYVEGSLAAPERASVEQHLAVCHTCAELVRDSTAALAFMDRVAEVEPPAELINRIVFAVPRPSAGQSKLRKWLDVALTPVRQPRYAMSLAMTILMFAMLARFVAPMRKIRPEDLKPARIWAGVENQAVYAWGRVLKVSDSLKVVYNIQTTLKAWQQRAEDQAPGASDTSPQFQDERKLPVRSAPSDGVNPGGSPPPRAPETTH
jgi:hypothetical protein